MTEGYKGKEVNDKTKFRIGDKVILSEDGVDYVRSCPTVNQEIINEIGEVYKVVTGSDAYDYSITFNSCSSLPVFSNEIEFAEEEYIQKEYVKSEGKVSDIGYFEKLGTEIGQLVDLKQLAYGDSVSQAFELMKVFLKNYKNEDGSYTIPESLLQHILLLVRMIDKMNRIVNNPEGDLMSENPFQDLVGYSMIGVKQEEKKQK